MTEEKNPAVEETAEEKTLETAADAETVELKAEPAYSQAEVDALNLRIADLESRLTEATESAKKYSEDLDTAFNKHQELNEILDEKNKEIQSCYKVIEERGEEIDKLKDAHEMMNAAIEDAAGGKFGRIDVPAMINKQRVVAACLEVEKNATCVHVADFIGAVRLFIDPDSGK